MKEISREDINDMLKDVDKEVFMTILKTWHQLMVKSYDDNRANMMMGLIEKYLADFFKWLYDQEEFKQVSHVKLSEFIRVMMLISRLKEPGLKQLIDGLEHVKKAA